MHGPRHAACETPATLSPDGFAALRASSLRDAACKPASPSSLISPILISRTTHWDVLASSVFRSPKVGSRPVLDHVCPSVYHPVPRKAPKNGTAEHPAARPSCAMHPRAALYGGTEAASCPETSHPPIANRQSPAIPGFVGIVVG